MIKHRYLKVTAMLAAFFITALQAEDSPARFTLTDPLPAGTAAHAAVALPGGDILVTGGYGTLFGRLPLVTSMARIYDHRRQTWCLARNHMNQARLNHAALRLPGGKVLIAGGIGQDRRPLASLELFDPRTEQFLTLPDMALARRNPKLNLLNDGRVLITGFDKQPELLEKTADPDDPDHPDGFRLRPTHGRTRAVHSDHAAVTLNDGSVILFGGRTTLIERFYPETEAFLTCQTRLPAVYDDQAAAVLYDGRVLLAAGQEVYTNRCIKHTWIYDPQKDTITRGPDLNPTALGQSQPGASDIMAVDLFSGDPLRQGRYILLCGGENDPGKETDPGVPRKPDVILDFACIYDAENNRFLNVGPMLTPHDDFAAVNLPPKDDHARALIIAGHGPDDSFLSQCEIFTWR